MTYFEGSFVRWQKYPPAESQCAQEVVSRIYVNHKTETLTVFCALMKVSGLRGLAFELKLEHIDTHCLFEALKNDGVDTETWTYKLEQVYYVVHAHWLKE